MLPDVYNQRTTTSLPYYHRTMSILRYEESWSKLVPALQTFHSSWIDPTRDNDAHLPESAEHYQAFHVQSDTPLLRVFWDGAHLWSKSLVDGKVVRIVWEPRPPFDFPIPVEAVADDNHRLYILDAPCRLEAFAERRLWLEQNCDITRLAQDVKWPPREGSLESHSRVFLYDKRAHYGWTQPADDGIQRVLVYESQEVVKRARFGPRESTGIAIRQDTTKHEPFYFISDDEKDPEDGYTYEGIILSGTPRRFQMTGKTAEVTGVKVEEGVDLYPAMESGVKPIEPTPLYPDVPVPSGPTVYPEATPAPAPPAPITPASSTRVLLGAIPFDFWETNMGPPHAYYSVFEQNEYDAKMLDEAMDRDIQAIREDDTKDDKALWAIAAQLGVLTVPLPTNPKDLEARLIQYITAEYGCRRTVFTKPTALEAPFLADKRGAKTWKIDWKRWVDSDLRARWFARAHKDGSMDKVQRDQGIKTVPILEKKLTDTRGINDATRQQLGIPTLDERQVRDLTLLSDVRARDSCAALMSKLQGGGWYVRFANPSSGGFDVRTAKEYALELKLVATYEKKNTSRTGAGAVMAAGSITTVSELEQSYADQWTKGNYEQILLMLHHEKPQSDAIQDVHDGNDKVPIMVQWPGDKQAIVGEADLVQYIDHAASKGPWYPHLYLSVLAGDKAWKCRTYIALKISNETVLDQYARWSHIVETTNRRWRAAQDQVKWLTTLGQNARESYWFGIWYPGEGKDALYDTPATLREWILNVLDIDPQYLDEEMYQAGVVHLPLPYTIRDGVQYRIIAADGKPSKDLYDIETRRVLDAIPSVLLSKEDLVKFYMPLVHVRATSEPTPPATPQRGILGRAADAVLGFFETPVPDEEKKETPPPAKEVVEIPEEEEEVVEIEPPPTPVIDLVPAETRAVIEQVNREMEQKLPTPPSPPMTDFDLAVFLMAVALLP